MCLVTKQKEALIAENDIPIWKLLTKEKLGYFFSFPYIFNTVYQTKMKIDNIPVNYFDNVVADYYNFKDFIEDSKTLTHIHEGLHSFIDKERIKNYRSNHLCINSIVVEGIIPKGSLYYIDYTGLVVSNQIKLLCITK